MENFGHSSTLKNTNKVQGPLRRQNNKRGADRREINLGCFVCLSQQIF